MKRIASAFASHRQSSREPTLIANETRMQSHLQSQMQAGLVTRAPHSPPRRGPPNQCPPRPILFVALIVAYVRRRSCPPRPIHRGPPLAGFRLPRRGHKTRASSKICRNALPSQLVLLLFPTARALPSFVPTGSSDATCGGNSKKSGFGRDQQKRIF